MFAKIFAFFAQDDSWSVQFDFDEGAQFAVYVAQKLGLTSLTEATADEALHVAWQEWWEQLCTQTLQQVTAAVEQSIADATPRDQLQEIAHRIGAVYDPPQFSHRASTPTLQAVCREQWPRFHKWWDGTDGEKARLASQMNAQIQHLNLPGLVKSCANTANKQKIKPFRLIIELVYWPSDHNRQLSPSLLVLGSQYIQTTHLNLLKERLSSIISGLV